MIIFLLDYLTQSNLFLYQTYRYWFGYLKHKATNFLHYIFYFFPPRILFDCI